MMFDAKCYSGVGLHGGDVHKITDIAKQLFLLV